MNPGCVLCWAPVVYKSPRGSEKDRAEFMVRDHYKCPWRTGELWRGQNQAQAAQKPPMVSEG